MKTENELGSTLSEAVLSEAVLDDAVLDDAVLDEVRGGVALLDRIQSERISKKIQGLSATAFDRLAVTDFGPLQPLERVGTLGLLVPIGD
ncbi:MAG: hypothetical protein ABW217_16460 [Polyangiaceae bacterium]